MGSFKNSPGCTRTVANTIIGFGAFGTIIVVARNGSATDVVMQAIAAVVLAVAVRSRGAEIEEG